MMAACGAENQSGEADTGNQSGQSGADSETSAAESGAESPESEAPLKTPDKGGGQEIAEGGELSIPLAEISETAKFYPVTIDGTSMEIVAVKAPDGSVRTAFNTCQVCFDSGRGYYEQQGDALVCQNCGNRFPMDRVEIEAGGCNPWPIFAENKTVDSDSIKISYDFLKKSKEIFANWKV
jgi:uncharacterized membrane protein